MAENPAEIGPKLPTALRNLREWREKENELKERWEEAADKNYGNAGNLADELHKLQADIGLLEDSIDANGVEDAWLAFLAEKEDDPPTRSGLVSDPAPLRPKQEDATPTPKTPYRSAYAGGFTPNPPQPPIYTLGSKREEREAQRAAAIKTGLITPNPKKDK